VLDILENEYKEQKISDKIEFFDNYLDRVASSRDRLFDYSVGLGLMRGLRCKSAEIQSQVISKAFEKGVIVLKAGRNTVRFLPPLTISKDEIDKGFKRFEMALMEVEAS